MLTFTDWENYTDNGGNPRTLNWSDDQMKGSPIYPYLEAVRQALVERSEMVGLKFIPCLYSRFPAYQTSTNRFLGWFYKMTFRRFGGWVTANNDGTLIREYIQSAYTEIYDGNSVSRYFYFLPDRSELCWYSEADAYWHYGPAIGNSLGHWYQAGIEDESWLDTTGCEMVNTWQTFYINHPYNYCFNAGYLRTSTNDLNPFRVIYQDDQAGNWICSNMYETDSGYYTTAPANIDEFGSYVSPETGTTNNDKYDLSFSLVDSEYGAFDSISVSSEPEQYSLSVGTVSETLTKSHQRQEYADNDNLHWLYCGSSYYEWYSEERAEWIVSKSVNGQNLRYWQSSTLEDIEYVRNDWATDRIKMGLETTLYEGTLWEMTFVRLSLFHVPSATWYVNGMLLKRTPALYGGNSTALAYYSYGGSIAFYNDSFTDLFLWQEESSGDWFLSPALGAKTVEYWTGTSPTGSFSPQADATGTLTISGPTSGTAVSRTYRTFNHMGLTVPAYPSEVRTRYLQRAVVGTFKKGYSDSSFANQLKERDVVENVYISSDRYQTVNFPEIESVRGRYDKVSGTDYFKHETEEFYLCQDTSPVGDSVYGWQAPTYISKVPNDLGTVIETSYERAIFPVYYYGGDHRHMTSFGQIGSPSIFVFASPTGFIMRIAYGWEGGHLRSATAVRQMKDILNACKYLIYSTTWGSMEHGKYFFGAVHNFNRITIAGTAILPYGTVILPMAEDHDCLIDSVPLSIGPNMEDIVYDVEIVDGAYVDKTSVNVEIADFKFV